ncbi:MAG: neutral/alkaline non-lysosomal ceramidase N-terminal domain-containing protein [Verrucomicrobiaceae bacterium]|nr:neutral/alkaline non-lysosomal ceramidase N-terminal domain-containing protein [Verrucomicrobiaceae bacterium]
MRSLFLPLLLIFSFISTILPGQENALWRAGAAAVDITPDYPVRLSGYGSRTTEYEKITQRIQAAALVLQWKDEPPAAIITVDNCGVPATLRAEVLRRLAAAGKNIADERLALHSSHTHCAPMLEGVLTNLFGTDLSSEHSEHVHRYTQDLTTWIVQAVTQAWEKLEPARLDHSEGKAYFGLNRRLRSKDGTLQNAPNFNGPTDRSLPLLRVQSADGKRLIATHASYACHCTTYSTNTIHGDWAGSARVEMQARFPGSVCLMAIGCGADQNPYPRNQPSRAEQHGTSIARELSTLIHRPMQTVSGPLTCATREILLPYDKAPTQQEWETHTADKNKWIARHARMHLAILAKGDKIPSALPYTVQTWQYGHDLLVINLPGEVVVDYSLRFKREFDPARTWVNAYTNDVPCYIPSQRVWEEGGYEGGGAMIYYTRPTRFATGVEALIAKAVHGITPPSFRVKK